MAKCPGCGLTWDGLAEAHCSAAGCHRHFGSVRAFDAHRVGGEKDRRCAAPSSLRRPDGNPLFDVRGRKSGDTYVLWRPDLRGGG